MSNSEKPVQASQPPRHRFTIDRSTWARGKRAVANWLLGDDGTRCCLGFFLASCGIPDNQMGSVGEPNEVAYDRYHEGDHNVDDAVPEPARFLMHVAKDEEAYVDCEGHLEDETSFTASDAAAQLMAFNDEPVMYDREPEIARIFAEHGVEVTFVDGKGVES